jgi:transposase-like protein
MSPNGKLILRSVKIMTEKKRRRLTAKTKFEIYLKTRGENAPIGEILREYGIHLSDLKEIEDLVEAGAINRLKTKQVKINGHADTSPEEVEELKKELARKEKALAEMSVEYLLLKKKDK